MNLHTDIKLFRDTIIAASRHSGIKDEFVEKDYWITLVLYRLSKSKYAAHTVFKGGTSLSKAYDLINRFSEDVDIAIVDNNKKSGNKIKAIIRTVQKEMTTELKELQVDGVSSKGSRFRKSAFEYVSIDKKNLNNRLIVEVNSFANPYPFQRLPIKSFVSDFLIQTDNEKYIEQYSLQPFEINVLNKEQTLMEKLVSLIRFSFEKDVTDSISRKMRHFYDLYFLMNDLACKSFIHSADFKTQFNNILNHDKDIFNEPKGWQTKSAAESPLVTDFNNIWKQLRDQYSQELSSLSFTPIPDEQKVAEHFVKLTKLIL